MDSATLAIELLKQHPGRLNPHTIHLLTKGLITGIKLAESSRMGFGEAVLEHLGLFDAGGMGSGQLYRPAYQDVVTEFGLALKAFIQRISSGLSGHRKRNWDQLAGRGYPAMVMNPAMADFFIAAYLGLCIERSMKPHRTPEDALRYGIAIYRGARQTVVAAQTALRESSPNRPAEWYPVAWAPVEQHLARSGTPAAQDLLALIRFVISYRYR